MTVRKLARLSSGRRRTSVRRLDLCWTFIDLDRPDHPFWAAPGPSSIKRNNS